MLKKTRLRAIIAFLIVALTLVLFIAFFVNNPNVVKQLEQVSVSTLVTLFGLYIIFTFSISLIVTATVKICKAAITRKESFLLTSYSAVINFFGPLQSGPAFRAIYLNQKHNVPIKKYTVASVGYYVIYGLISVLLLLSSYLGVFFVPILLVSLLVAGLVFYKFEGLSQKGLNNAAWLRLLAATLLQILILIIIFGIELKTIQSDISWSQILVYTGAANLALFVSITPGAIGFREAFLVFSQKLHGIDTSTIVAANTIDRGVYVIMLIGLSVLIAITHSKDRFQLTSQGNKPAKASASE